MASSKDRMYVGIDLGGTNVRAGVVNAQHRVLGSHKRKTRAELPKDEVIERIAKTVDEALLAAKLDRKDIAGVGIGAPGAIHIGKGVVLEAVNLRWTDYPLASALEKKLGLGVTVDNDVNVGTWGEKVAGAAREFDDLLGVFIGTGIGGGIVLGGHLYHGHFNTAGEIGHTLVFPDGMIGRRTLENLASRTAIADLLRDLIRSNKTSVLPALAEGQLEELRSKTIAQAMEKGDEISLRVVGQAARYVGVAIANVVTVMSLPCVVLGGGFVDAVGKPFVKLVREAFADAVFPSKLRECRIIQAELGDDAGVVGAADLARQRLGK